MGSRRPECVLPTLCSFELGRTPSWPSGLGGDVAVTVLLDEIRRSAKGHRGGGPRAECGDADGSRGTRARDAGHMGQADCDARGLHRWVLVSGVDDSVGWVGAAGLRAPGGSAVAVPGAVGVRRPGPSTRSPPMEPRTLSDVNRFSERRARSCEATPRWAPSPQPSAGAGSAATRRSPRRVGRRLGFPGGRRDGRCTKRYGGRGTIGR